MSDTLTSVYTFGQGNSSDSLHTEIDGQMHLDAEGEERSSFAPGDVVYFLLHYDPAKIRVLGLRATDDGDIQLVGPVVRTRKEELSFQHPAHLLDLGYIPAGALSAEWFGRSSNLFLDGRQVQADLAPCLGEVSYPVNFVQYSHRPAVAAITDGEDFPTDIVIEYEEIN